MSAPARGSVQSWAVRRASVLRAALLTASPLPGVVAPPTPAAPSNLIPPSIFGTPEVGNTLVVNPGAWSGYPSPSITRAWLRDGAPTGVSGNSYPLMSGDAGKTITVRETATNTEGSASVTSSGVAVAASGGPAEITAPVLALTSAAGTAPLTFSEAIDGTVAAGFTRRIQTASDLGFTSIIQDLYKQVEEGEINNTDASWSLSAVNPPRRYADNVLEALVLDGSGFIAIREKIIRDDGVESDWSNVISDTLPNHVLLPTTTGVDKSAFLTVAENRLTFSGDPGRGTTDHARASGSGIVDPTCYEVTIDVVAPDDNRPVVLAFEYEVGGAYADLSGGGTVTGLSYLVLQNGIYNPAVGFISGAVNVGDVYHLRLHPADGTASLYRIRSGVETLINTMSGLPTGKTWRAVIGASGTGGVSATGTANFGATPLARTPDTGYLPYEQLAA